jgi:hypothetical protein
VRTINWFKYSSPASFYPLAGKLIPYFTVLAVVLTAIGLYMGFFVAPTDYKQGEGYRIMFIHVPAAWMSMFIYLVMAVYAGAGLVFNTRLSSMMASALAPTGALFTFLALWTGSFWGKPMWGTWWVWDARLTSELILLFLYIGFMSLKAAIDDPRPRERAAGHHRRYQCPHHLFFRAMVEYPASRGLHIFYQRHFHGGDHADHLAGDELRILDVCHCGSIGASPLRDPRSGGRYRMGGGTIG